MSIPVPLDRLHDEIERLGPSAYLISIAGDGRPHCVSVSLSRRGDDLVMETGPGTATGVAQRPLVTLLIPPTEEGGLSLIVDCTAAPDPTDGTGAQGRAIVRVTPTKAVLHRGPSPVS
jgi:hypothetical protein